MWYFLREFILHFALAGLLGLFLGWLLWRWRRRPVDAADYYRAIAEYWADGPTSETPPGHWNSIAHGVSDAIDPDDRLRWDVQLGVALNGALHDAAIAAWGNKAFYDSIRPISMIRWMAEQDGDRSLPLVDGLIEEVTADSAAPGERHEGLLVGDTAIFAWAGSPDDPDDEVAGSVRLIRVATLADALREAGVDAGSSSF